jgi:hypothetical protein
MAKKPKTAIRVLDRQADDLLVKLFPGNEN